jgi:protein-disulfide isomerase
MGNILQNKRLLTGVMAAIGIGIIIFYIFCDDSCRYLQGGIWGLDLKYLGLVFMSALILLTVLKNDNLFLALISLGIGAEIFLIGYQIKNSTYCPFCLAFGLVLVLIFAINFQKKKLPLIAIMAVLGLLFLLLTFKGSATPAFAEENFITSFGSGRVNVRIYTDYFCAPCRAAEPEIEALLTKLLEKNAIRLTLVDTPVHKETPLYARYFLYILNENKRFFTQAMLARGALFEAAAQNILTAKDLEAFLAKKNIKFKPLDAAPLFKNLENYIKEDSISSTPSCVIYGPKGKELSTGKTDIVKGLKGILENKAQLQ